MGKLTKAEPLQGGDRPSDHGARLGKALADMDAAGRAMRADIPPKCGTCAFTEGSMPNQSAGTGLMALKCVLGIDPDRFACHHAMTDGQPNRLCGGYLAAKCAPFPEIKAIVADLNAALADGGIDKVRQDFDAWAMSVDPEGRLDVYELSRLYARRSALQEDA